MLSNSIPTRLLAIEMLRAGPLSRTIESASCGVNCDCLMRMLARDVLSKSQGENSNLKIDMHRVGILRSQEPRTLTYLSTFKHDRGFVNSEIFLDLLSFEITPNVISVHVAAAFFFEF